MTTKDYLTTKDISKLKNVSMQTVLKWKKKGLKGTKINNKWVFALEEIEEFEKKTKQKKLHPDDEMKTFHQISQELGLSQTVIINSYKTAIQKIKQAMQDNNITIEDLIA